VQALFTFAIFLSATLLFLVQPMVGKILLPSVGGSPAVWNTCMVFFQAVLLAGYLYAHLLSKLQMMAQVIVHAVVLTIALAFVPFATQWTPPTNAKPIPWLLETLGLMAALPFFAISSTGPLLQRWFSRTQSTRATDPYFLYAASNAGSIVGLLAYPILMEPRLIRADQALAWAWGVRVLAVGVLLCGFVAWYHATRAKRAPQTSPPQTPDSINIPSTNADAPITNGRRLRWILLAAVPSSLMLGVTQHLTSDVAAVPLLWMIPLLVYLGSTILAFSSDIPISSLQWARFFPIAASVAVWLVFSQSFEHLLLVVIANMAVFFLASMMCHRALYENRPRADRLTEFYLWIALGGVLGGSFNALVAPVVFDRILEYPIVLAIACFLRPQVWQSAARSRRSWLMALLAFPLMLAVAVGLHHFLGNNANDSAKLVVRGLAPALLCLALWPLAQGRVFAAAAAAVLLAAPFLTIGPTVLFRARTFFGVHQVQEVLTNDPTTGKSIPQVHALIHGNTQHGLQFVDNPNRPQYRPSLSPTTYYHRKGPIGQVIEAMQGAGRLKTMGAIGLGVGTLAAYGIPGMHIEFIEIDHAVGNIANNPAYFKYLAQCRASWRCSEGDGRLLIQSAPEGVFDLIVVDAFSSDSIPIHLLTQEAVAIYMRRLAPGGILAFHISNRSFRLGPILKRIADEQGLAFRMRFDPETIEAEGKLPSDWVIMARSPDALGPFASNPQWADPPVKYNTPLWTDDYSNILSALKVFSRR
jgi:hypothetical protein